MLHLRLIVPSDLAGAVLDRLGEHESVTNLVRLPGAAKKPAGDVVLCDVAREDASVVLGELRALELDERGSIAVESIDVSISSVSDAAEEAAKGAPGDAVVWEEVEAQTSASAELTLGFILLMIISTLIAAVGLVTDSVVLIIGAMVVGPEFGPLAGVCVAVIERRPELALRSTTALLVGFPIGIAVSFGAMELLLASGIAPERLVHQQTMFVSHPDAYSVIIALVAGVAGMLSLTTAKSGALIGVFISVTTIPAAANMAVAAAYRDLGELGGAALQLGVNLVAIVIAGVLTLLVQRLAFVRRAARIVRARSRARRKRRRPARG